MSDVVFLVWGEGVCIIHWPLNTPILKRKCPKFHESPKGGNRRRGAKTLDTSGTGNSAGVSGEELFGKREHVDVLRGY